MHGHLNQLAQVISRARTGFAELAPRLRRPFSLRSQLVGVVLVAILPGLGAAMFNAASASRLAEQVRQQRLDDTAISLAAAVDQELEIATNALSVLADSRGLEVGGDLSEFIVRAGVTAETIGAQIVWRPDSGNATLTAPDWIMRERRAETSTNAVNPIIEALLGQVRDTRRMAVSDVFVSAGRRLPITAIIVPVVRNGALLGTIELMMTSDHLTAALRHQTRQADGLAVLVDRQGRVAAASRDVASLVGQIYREPPEPPRGWIDGLLHGARSGEASSASPSRTVVPIAARAALVYAPSWRILYGEETAMMPAAGHALGENVLAGLVAALLGLGFVAALGDQLTRPLRALAALASSVAIGGDPLAETMPPSSVTEFEALRQGMVRADAVLRRRGAAERMALREARTGHELLTSVVNGTAEMIHVKDLELRYVLVNRAALQIGPEPREEWQVLGRSVSDLYPASAADRIEAADRTVLSTGLMVNLEFECPTHLEYEPVHWVAMTITPWQDAGGRVVGVVSVSRDITRQRNSEARMRALQADLLRATRLSAMGAMASGLAHELNQPLAAATNYLNAGGRLLDRGMLGDEVAFRAARGAVMEAAQQMLRAGTIVRRLRDFVERGEVELRAADAGEILQEACDLARTDGVTAGILLRTEIANGERTVLVDRTQIQQVLLNLIRNAAEAIASDENVTGDEELGTAQPTRTVQPKIVAGEIVVSARRSFDGGMEIEVADNGPGLAHGIAERLFEPFVSSKPTGMGIGLSICRTIVEGHGGTLTTRPTRPSSGSGAAADDHDRGMRFRIVLPALNPIGDQS